MIKKQNHSFQKCSKRLCNDRTSLNDLMGSNAISSEISGERWVYRFFFFFRTASSRRQRIETYTKIVKFYITNIILDGVTILR